MQIEPATVHDVPAIRDLNSRLRAGNAGFELPESAETLGVSRDAGMPVWHEVFVAKDGPAVHGGYALKRELLRAQGKLMELRNYQIPLSEGIVNKAYAMVGIQLLQHAMSQASELYCLGMGSMQRPLPRLLSRLSWSVEPVPFFFRVIHGTEFLRHIRYLRDSRLRRGLLALALYSGVGTAAAMGWRAVAFARKPRLPPEMTVRTVPDFGSDADTIFGEVADQYGAIVDRTSRALNVRFPVHDRRLIRLVFHRDSKPIGWLVLTSTRLKDHKQFGSMALGCIVDGLCEPSLAPVLIRAGVDLLIKKGVALIVSNQSHAAWINGLRRNSFAAGPSNYIFARSPGLTATSPGLAEWHINRGDGDGPINL